MARLNSFAEETNCGNLDFFYSWQNIFFFTLKKYEKQKIRKKFFPGVGGWGLVPLGT